MDIFTDVTRDLPKTRKLGVEDVDFQIKQHDPYGWWKVSRERGQVPAELAGWYTRPELAEAAVAAYRLKVTNAQTSKSK